MTTDKERLQVKSIKECVCPMYFYTMYSIPGMPSRSLNAGLLWNWVGMGQTKLNMEVH